jgi:pheromone shutdown protein TraB
MDAAEKAYREKVQLHRRWILFMGVMFACSAALVFMYWAGVGVPMWVALSPPVAGPLLAVAGGFLELFFKAVFMRNGALK